MLDRSLKIFLCIGGLLVFAVRPAMADRDCLRFGAPDSPNLIKIVDHISDVIRDAGICHTVEYLPLIRLTRMALAGELDGEISRAGRYLEVVKGVMQRVPEPYVEAAGLMVTKNPDIRTIEAATKSELGLMLGSYWAEGLAGNAPNVQAVHDEENLFGMLSAGRLDAILVEDILWERFADQPGFDAYSAHLMTDLTGHVYVSNAYAHLVPKIDAALRTFKAAGGRFGER